MKNTACIIRFRTTASLKPFTTRLDCLPTQVREIMELRNFQEFSFREIAETLGIGLSAAKMRLYRSLEHFKNRYLKLQEESALCTNSGTIQRT